MEESRSIVIPRNESEANSSVQRLIIDKGTTTVGLDCEWRPGQMSCAVALIQVAAKDHVILFQVCRFENENTLPRKLADILQHRGVIKVGVNIEEDVRRIRLQFQEPVLAWLDLRCFAIQNQMLGENLLKQLEDYESKLNKETLPPAEIKAKRTNFMPKLGLETLVGNCLSRALPKSFTARVLGTWDASQLTRELKLYAAADAAASLDVFHALASQIAADQNLDTTEEFSWSTVLEKPYEHKKIRLSCLEMVVEVAPSRILAILPEYFGRSYNKRSNKVPLEYSSALQDEIHANESTCGTEEKTEGIVERGLFHYIKRLFELLFTFGLVMIVASIAIPILIMVLIDKLSNE